MPRLTIPQRLARERLETATRSGLPPERLAAALVDALAVAIPVDGYRLFGLDPRTLLINRLLAASVEDAWARLEWLREVYLDEPLPYMRNSLLMRRGLPAVAFQERQELSWGYPPELLHGFPPATHRERFHEGQSPAGGTIILSIPANGRWLAALLLYRRDPNRPFKAQDVAFARAVAPRLGEALAAALARERATVNEFPAPDASGILVLSPGGKIGFTTPAGEAWLQRLRDADPGGHAPLPSAVWAAMAALRADGAVGALTVETAAGPLRVEASPAGSEESVAVTLAPVAPPAPPEPPAGWDLTAQERAVCMLVLRGASNARIAAALSISENTVETHLHHIFAKTGVSTRVRLVARYFQETMLPDFAIEADAGEKSG